MTEADGTLSRRAMLGAMGVAGGIAAVAIGIGSDAARALQLAPGGMYYPTDPWLYNNAPGTRYMDPRDDNNDGVPDRYHLGVDSQGALGSGIYAVLAGQVVGGSWSPNSGYGNHVDIDHGNGFKTRYAHFNQAPRVSMGQHVSAGQRIGDMGSTGYRIYHVHLHFEVRRNNTVVNPLDFLAGTLGTQNPNQPEDDLTPEQALLLGQIHQAIFTTPDQPGGWAGINKQIGDLRQQVGEIHQAVFTTPEQPGGWSGLADTLSDIQQQLDQIEAQIP